MPMSPAAALLISNLPLSGDGGTTCFWCGRHPSDHWLDCPRAKAELGVEQGFSSQDDIEFRAMYRQITGGK